MSAPTFTPGPWHTDASKSFYVFAHGSLAEQAGVRNGPFVANASTEANARLISAAPELLGALSDILRIARAATLHSGGDFNRKRIARAEAAIAKARGEG